jgi:arginyl-tRNA--protein-N-Asp/Glu arginylyltransferase
LRVLRTLVHQSPTCSYLSDRASALDTKIALDVTPTELEAMLSRGWRRFGPTYFRPRCAPCGECVGIRVPVEGWKPSRSQRRVLNANADLIVQVDDPSTTRDRLSLYAKWHAFRERERGWEPSALDAESYSIEFAFPHASAREIAYWLPDRVGRSRLVAVGLCDQTPRALSAVYCYYDPALAERSLGVFNVLTQLRLAREQGLPYVYLGYRVAPCASMAYKSRFRPHELLFDRPDMDVEPSWVLQPDSP